MSRTALLLLVSVFLMPGLLLADDASPLSIGGRATYFAPKDGDAGWGGGAQARLRLPLFFGAEASIDHRQMDVSGGKLHDWPVQVSGLIYILPRIIVVQPFILGGVGWYHTTFENSNGSDTTDTRFGPHAGAGVEFNLN